MVAQPRLGFCHGAQLWWSQNQKKAANNESIRYLLTNYPSQISALQEHDARILTTQDRANFHVCCGIDEDGAETYLAILGRMRSRNGSPCISAVTLLECLTYNKRKGGKDNITPIMVAEIRWGKR